MEQVIEKTSKAALKKVCALIKQYPQYYLSKYRSIFAEMIGHLGGIENFEGKSFLELGPGNQVNMMRFLVNEMSIANIQAVGKSILWPWCFHKDFIRKYVENDRLFYGLRKMPSEVYDVIYSRHVMELYSINPWILLSSNVYWQYIRENRFKNPQEDFPASKPNIQAVFREAYRLLKPGGIIISQIAKRKYSGLDQEFLKGFYPQKLEESILNKLSSMVIFVK